MPCHVPTCPTRPGPSGFCALHQNRINARIWSGVADLVTDADRIAVAAHPGWRGRKWRLEPIAWGSTLCWHVSTREATGPHFPTAAEALAELDRRNGLTPAADVARLEAELSAIRTHRDALEERRQDLAADNDLLAGDVCFFVRVADGMRADLDKQAATIARLTSELAERERDVTDLCAERDGYAADLATARRTASSDAAIIDNLRTGVRLLEDDLTLARRPWWRKVWAWVTGGVA